MLWAGLTARRGRFAGSLAWWSGVGGRVGAVAEEMREVLCSRWRARDQGECGEEQQATSERGGGEAQREQPAVVDRRTQGFGWLAGWH